MQAVESAEGWSGTAAVTAVAARRAAVCKLNILEETTLHLVLPSTEVWSMFNNQEESTLNLVMPINGRWSLCS